MKNVNIVTNGQFAEAVDVCSSLKETYLKSMCCLRSEFATRVQVTHAVHVK